MISLRKGEITMFYKLPKYFRVHVRKKDPGTSCYYYRIHDGLTVERKCLGVIIMAHYSPFKVAMPEYRVSGINKYARCIE